MDSFRHAIRSLARSPGFAIVSILTLALGIGATTAVVSVVDHVLLHALPFRDADRLVLLLERDAHGAMRTPSAPTAHDWRNDPGVRSAFDGISFVRGDGVLLGIGEGAERAAAAYVGPEFFTLIGARPILGRTLVADDHRPGAPPVIVISSELWHRRFGGDPGIVGHTLAVDSVPSTIVGVMPAGATWPDFASIWESVSQYTHQDILTRRGLHADSRTIGRLRPGIDSARAMAAMRAIEARLGQDYPADQARWSAALQSLRTAIVGDVGPMLLMLAAAAALVLLLACANVGNLLLVRLSTRARELAVRSALGASRGRLVRQLLGESALLAVTGGVLGTLLAAFAIDLARTLPPNRLPRVQELSVDGRVLVVGAAASLLTAIVFGVWPAIRATGSSLAESLRADARGATGGRAESRVRRVLVVAQFGLALVLLVGAGLLLQSFRRAATVDAGFDPSGLVTVRIDPGAAYRAPDAAAALYRRLIEATRAVPGVVDAAFINHVPFGGAAITTSVEIEGRGTRDTASNQIFYRTVSDGYARTMKLSMIVGRWFDGSDVRSPGGSFVINEAMARRYWPGASAIGKRITVRRASQARPDFGQPLPGTVIGVIHDVHQAGLDVPPDPEVYVPYTLETWPWGSLVVRVHDRGGAMPALRRAIASVDPGLLPAGAAGENAFGSLDEAIAATLASRKLPMTLIGVFAACALALAAIGLYGVIAFSVAQRTRELGVRKALGATDSMIGALVVRESLALTAAGVVVGCAAAWAAARLIRGLLFDTGTADPGAYLATVALLGAVALLASWVPARRATRLDVMEAIRGE